MPRHMGRAGAVIGVVLAGALADRLGEKPVISGAFGIAAVSVLLFSLEPPTVPLLLLGAVAGFGSNTQTLVNAFVGGRYPANARATALGWALGVGRVGAIVGPTYGGWILTEVNAGTLSAQWNFYAFAIPALVAAALILAVPRGSRPADGFPPHAASEEPSITGEKASG
ncbi:MFS transporter [Streptomyces winkii]|uniref:MFS transporter n=1 Tax=Streptomyces winkii TaxID=3051178 RepID=UPI0028D12963|nr:MFS transporter [Streptomyces sp. DSM 40971]